MKSIYDEAIEYLKNGSDDLYSYQVLQIIKALERAKKVEELLELYQNSSHYQIGFNLGCLSVDDKIKWIEIEKQIKQLEEEMK